MSILEEVLKEEYERSERIKQMCLEKLRDLPAGYLSKKIIKGKEYFYWQNREGGKVVSKYVSPEHVEALQKIVADRRKYQQKIRDVEADQKKIRKAVGPLVER